METIPNVGDNLFQVVGSPVLFKVFGEPFTIHDLFNLVLYSLTTALLVWLIVRRRRD